MDALPGGFLGTVSALSQDGRTVDLVAAGLADAFDYYDLDVADIGAVAQQEEAVPEESAQAAAAAAPDSAPAAARVPSRGGERRSSGPAVARLAAVDTECGKTRVDGTLISFDPGIDLGGRFETHVDKYSFLGVEVPTGASVDMAMTATVTGAAKVEATANVRCNIKLPRVFKTFATYPVPMAISIRPTAEINVEGVFDVENVGFTATAGMEASAKITLSGIGFDSGPIQEAGPLLPARQDRQRGGRRPRRRRGHRRTRSGHR